MDSIGFTFKSVKYYGLLILFSMSFVCGCSQNPTMDLPYERVHDFKDEVCILTTFVGRNVIKMDVGGAEEQWMEVAGALELCDKPGNYFPIPAIAVCPNGSQYYLCNYDNLGICQNNRVLHTIPIETFELGDGEFRFYPLAFASNDRLWFSAYRPSNFKEYLIVEWEVKNEPVTRKVIPVSRVIGNWNVDTDTGQVFVPDDAKGIGKPYDYEFWSGDFFDYDQNNGLLISNHVADHKRDKIFFREKDKESYKMLNWGGQAQWGSDGYFYFLRGSTQLWRQKPGDSSPESVFRGTRRIEDYENYYGHELKIDASGRYLAFSYNINTGASYPENYYNGLLLIDLQMKEYIHFSPAQLRDKYLEMFFSDRLYMRGDIFTRFIDDLPLSYIQNMEWLNK